MKNIALSFLIVILATGCGSRKKIVTKKSESSDRVETVESTPTSDNNETQDNDIPKVLAKNATTAYIEMYKPIAIAEMNTYGIPASITLAQGILESGSGRGRLAIEANNHFGIKCHDWVGDRIFHDDDRSQECFRKYSEASKSFRDHSEFLVNRKRYAKLFQLKRSDYKGWAKELRKAGYATDRKYPEKLISLIERFELYKYDNFNNHQNAEIVAPDEHVVVKGDTLYSISKRYNVPIEYIKKLNGLQSNAIALGQVLYLRYKE
ncbi:MAG: glucosaminidase domain-containing protein [Bacteroidia bacterium]|nr:glucosaminidase domain-containing protein [Bacteroidia bacterium]NND26609.1 LysM peptidoglycan-binding domain-containing protein [Flavobacteriaceae bacterium]